MANATPNRLGQVQNAGDEKALFLKQYAGEVLASFVEEYKLAGHVTERNISHGKSASFPAIGTIGSEYHVPGTEITGMNVQHNEVILTLDPMLISHVFIPNIDEAMNHYDVRSEYTRQQGLELAKQRQLNELRCAILAARQTTGPVNGQPGGLILKDAAMATDATKLAAAIRQVRQAFDEKNVPDEDVIAALKPAQWYLLTQVKDLVDRDYNPTGGASLSQAVIESVARIKLLKTNFFPSADDSANAALQAKYRADYSKSVCSVFHKSAVGTLKLLDLALEDAYDVRRQGTLMLSKFALGHGALRAAGAAELVVGS
ncbi:phage capsid protein [Luteibacter sp. ME-Dv--P-043b]|jgi:hypothetical protein|uniref:phage capsid protein n=1 Tax=Luteibacter sp. ME-Dv--P-043b TaxID=3040291 RepID=UPI002554123E|nr:phage capsid protein [Luteibacter sp. ME-Dv--P-043b]